MAVHQVIPDHCSAHTCSSQVLNPESDVASLRYPEPSALLIVRQQYVSTHILVRHYSAFHRTPLNVRSLRRQFVERATIPAPLNRSPSTEID